MVGREPGIITVARSKTSDQGKIVAFLLLQIVTYF